MRREIRLFLLITIFIFGLIFVQFNPFFGNGPVQTKVMELPDFKQMDIDIPYNVYLVEGDMNSMVVEGPGKEIRKIFFEMEDTILNIQRKKDKWLKEWINEFLDLDHDINVYVTVKDISQINVRSTNLFSIQKTKDDSPIGWLIQQTKALRRFLGGQQFYV